MRMILTLLTMTILGLAFGCPHGGACYADDNPIVVRNGVYVEKVDVGEYRWDPYTYKYWWYPKYEYRPVKFNFDDPKFDVKLLDAKKVQLLYRYNLQLFRDSGLAEPYGYPSSQEAYGAVGSHGYSGNTQYRVTFNQLKEAYGGADLMAGYQASVASSDAARQTFDATNARHNETLRLMVQGFNTNAEIETKFKGMLATAEALKALAQAIRPEPRVTTQTRIEEVRPQVQPQADPPVPMQAQRNWPDTLDGCISCHDTRKKVNIDLRKWSTLSDKDYNEVMRRIHSDGNDRMPPPNEGKQLNRDQVKSLHK